MAATLTTREIAQAHRVSLRTAQRWAANGKLHAIKMAGRWVITIEANLSEFKPAQIERARELIAQGGIVPIPGRRMFLAVSNKGDRTYLTAAQACNCAAGIKGRYPCFHRIAAVILTATRRAA